MILRGAGVPAPVLPAARRDIHLAPEDRIQAAVARVVVKDHRREQVAVLGDRNRRHLQRDGLIEDLVNPARAVEEGKLGMEMEMNELSHDLGTQSPRSTQSYCGLCLSCPLRAWRAWRSSFPLDG